LEKASSGGRATRALQTPAFNAWYEHEIDDVGGLVDDRIGRLRAIVVAMPAHRMVIAQGETGGPTCRIRQVHALDSSGVSELRRRGPTRDDMETPAKTASNDRRGGQAP
jgi:hypothetical protein